MGLQDRVYVADQQGTEAKMNSWRYRMAKFPNTITLSYSFHEGFDNPDGDINVVAKIPFKMLDEIGRAELNYNPKMYTLDAAIKTQQACGRTRRGRDEHYEMDGEPERKVVAIADGNYQRIENMLSPSFKECVVSY
jgi:Rad3-related DNA helicase